MTAGDPALVLGDAAQPVAPAGARRTSCLQQFQSGVFYYVTRIRDRRFVAVDPERGLAFAFAFFDNGSGEARRGTLADGRTVVSGPSVPWTWQIAEVFRSSAARSARLNPYFIKCPTAWAPAGAHGKNPCRASPAGRCSGVLFTGARRSLSLSFSRQRGGLLGRYADPHRRSAPADRSPADGALVSPLRARRAVRDVRPERDRPLTSARRVAAVHQEGVRRQRYAAGAADGHRLRALLLDDGDPDCRLGRSGQSTERPGAGGRGVERHDGVVRSCRQFRHALRGARGDGDR